MIIISKDQPVVIGVDTGYGNIKTANTCFPTGVTAWDTEPTFKNDLLIYEGRYYTIGSGHKEYSADKIGDNDFYLLTLAAIARELNIRGMTEAKVFLGAGLPLTWVGKQKDEFKAYQYLKKPVKETVNKVVDAIAALPQVAKCYEVRNLLKDELDGYYHDISTIRSSPFSGTSRWRS